MPYPNEHAARMMNPDQFDKFARKTVAPGIDIILGMKGTASDVQAYRFDKSKFTPEEAKAWLDKHSIKPISFEPAATDQKQFEQEYCEKVFTGDTFETVKDIFSVGTWNGDAYSEADLDNMIQNFERGIPIPLKVNFFKKDAVKDGKFHGGVPAVGWVKKLYREGSKLYAQITDIPKVIKDLIDKKAYRQVSAEMVWNMKQGEERLRRVITGIGLLGVEMPGVSNLDEFAQLYGREFFDEELVKIYVQEQSASEDARSKQEDFSMSPEEIKKLQDDKLKAEQEAKEAKDYAAKLEGEKKIADEKAAEQTRKADKLARSQRTAEIKNFVAKMETEGKVLPKSSAAIISIFENLEDTKTVKFTVEGKEQEKSVRKLFEEYLEGLPKLVEFSEKSQTGKETKTDEEKLKEFTAKDAEEFGTIEGQKLDFLTKEYVKEHDGTSYADALNIVSKAHPELL